MTTQITDPRLVPMTKLPGNTTQLGAKVTLDS